MRMSRAVFVASLLALAVASVLGVASPAASQSPSVEQAVPALVARARQRGNVRVIVGLNVPVRPETGLSTPELASQRSVIFAAQEAFARNFGLGSVVRAFQTIPFTTLSLTADEVARLARMPGITSVSEDTLSAPTLNTSTTLINARWNWQRGRRGAGWSVAVLDTGHFYRHRAFTGAVSQSACFSSNDDSWHATSLCRGGATRAVGSFAAPVCPASVDGCDHGTHVASTVAARLPNSHRGVAPEAGIIPIQVFTRFSSDSSSCGFSGNDCVLSFQSDQIAALEHVLMLSASNQIAAVNMSLGGGRYTSRCDGDFPAYTAIVNNLTAAGVAVVIASGNSSYRGAVGFPACLSNAITVGATDDNDAIAGFSNQHARLIDLMAPGVGIIAAGIGSRSELVSLSGTSMAAPHVAGAFALLRSDSPNASVAQIRYALRCTGTPVTRAGTAGAFYRIDLRLARQQLRWGRVPGC